MTPEHTLDIQPNLSKMLFERMPMGMAILDSDYNIIRYNPTWEEFSKKYAPPSGAPLTPGVNYFDLLPGSESIATPLFERVLAGETIQQKSKEFVSGDITSYWDLVLAPLIDDGKVNGILNVTNDVTEYTLLKQNLEQRVEERTHELRTLLQVSKDINTNLDLEKVLDTILDQLKTVVDFSGASILSMEGEQLVIRASQGLITWDAKKRSKVSIEETLAMHAVFKKNKPVSIPNIHNGNSLARIFQVAADGQMGSTFKDIYSWMGVPLVFKDVTQGMLTLVHTQPDHFSDQHADIVMTIANHAAVAIENARLYQETEQKVEESQTLFSVQQAITSKLELDEVLQMIADEARRLTSTDISGVYLLKGGELEIAYVSGDVPKSILGYRLSLDSSIAGKVMREQKSILTNDTWDDPNVDRSASDHVKARSLLIVPLISSQGPVGTITVANNTPGTFKPGVEELLTKLAANVVISLENAQLYESEQDRRQVAEGLRETLAVLNSKKPLDEILNHIAEQAVQMMGARCAIFYRIEPDSQELIIQAGCQIPEAISALKSVPLHESESVARMFNHQPSTICDFDMLHLDDSLPENDKQLVLRKWRQCIKENYGSYLGVPLIIDDDIYGSLGLYYKKPNNFPEEQIELGVALANQAVLAVENARLLKQSEGAAIVAERNRLARDLHDAVTQTLFSASMIADVLPKIWERDPDEGRRRLEELRQLTRGALSEMRTLLVELRPAALVETDLGDLIGHQVNAFVARTRIQVKYENECEQSPPPEIKEMFYRVVQEAFNNIAKHANARMIQVNLQSDTKKTVLIVKDDGVGFDIDVIKNHGLGLGIMKERAHNLGAVLEIKSQTGKGTQINVTWQKQPLKENKHG